MNHKFFTEISMYGIAIASLLLWMFQFLVFMLGYDMIWKESNFFVALTEYIMIGIVITFFIEIYIQKIKMEVCKMCAKYSELIFELPSIIKKEKGYMYYLKGNEKGDGLIAAICRSPMKYKLSK